MKTIGLTGGIGSGKSTAAGILRDLGAHVIDADRIGHEVYRPGTEGWRRVVAAFGSGIVAADGTIDRKRLGAIVFAESNQLTRLNSIVHPLIREEIRTQIAARRATAGLRAPIVVEAAVLIEADWGGLVDEVWVVVAHTQAVIDRVQAQRGLDPAGIEARKKAQLSDDDRCRHADVVIDNSGTIEQLRDKLTTLWRERLSRDTQAG